MSCTTSDLIIQKGKTFMRVLRWEATPYVWKPITGITKAAPPVVTAAGHGLVDGQSAAILSVVGMREINAKVPAKGQIPSAGEWKKITYIDANAFSLNGVNALDFTAYTSGGTVVYRTPVSLSGYSARMMVRETEESTGTPLISLVSPTDIALDDTAKTITITISAVATAALDFLTGVYDLELVSGTGVVTQLLKGNVTVEEEVTR